MKMLKDQTVEKHYFKFNRCDEFAKFVIICENELLNSCYVDFSTSLDRDNMIVRIDEIIKSVDWYDDNYNNNVANLTKFENIIHTFGKFYIYDENKLKKETSTAL